MSAPTISPSLLQPAAAPAVVPGRIRETAQQFEATFLSQMMKPMFEGLSTEAPFGGGDAEQTWRGFLIDAMAKQTVKAGGIGLSDKIMSEMMRMQEQGQ